MKKRIIQYIIVISVIGVLLSLYLTNVHYSDNKSICDISETLSCSAVSQSKHAEILGIPVAIFGVLGYGFLGLISYGLKRKWQEKKISNLVVSPKILFSFSVMAFLVSLHLTYAEFFIIKKVCILCILSQILILGVMVLSYKYFKGGN